MPGVDHLADAIAGRPLAEDADETAQAVAEIVEEGQAARALANLFFERLTEMWHTSDTIDALHAFCGLDFESYGAFIEGRWADAAAKIDA
jgi:hypothetical protein